MRSPKGIAAFTTATMLFVFLAGCGGAANTAPGNSSGEVPKLGQEFVLQEGEGAVLAGKELEVRFEAVESEGRCPDDPEIRCVWQGYAEISLRIQKQGEEASLLPLYTPGAGARYPSEAGYLDYKVELLALDPYPSSPDDAGNATYTATLKVANN